MKITKFTSTTNFQLYHMAKKYMIAEFDIPNEEIPELLDHMIENLQMHKIALGLAEKESKGMSVWLIKGEMERNHGKIIIECGTSRNFFNEFFESLYGNDHPEGAEMPLGEYRVKLIKQE